MTTKMAKIETCVPWTAWTPNWLDINNFICSHRLIAIIWSCCSSLQQASSCNDLSIIVHLACDQLCGFVHPHVYMTTVRDKKCLAVRAANPSPSYETRSGLWRIVCLDNTWQKVSKSANHIPGTFWSDSPWNENPTHLKYVTLQKLKDAHELQYHCLWVDMRNINHRHINCWFMSLPQQPAASLFEGSPVSKWYLNQLSPA